jgi:hypothetical protein
MNAKEKRADSARLKEVLSRNECPVCSLLSDDEFDLLCHWVGKSGPEDGATEERIRLSDSNGFCNYHFWRFAKISGMYGNAVMSIDQIGKILNIPGFNGKGNNVIALLKDHIKNVRCPVCADLKDMESAYLEELMSLLNEEENKMKYAQGDGLCLPHLMLLSERKEAGPLLQFLIERESVQMGKIKADAVNLGKKRNPPLSWEQTRNEKRSGLRAIKKLVGRQGQKILDKTNQIF